MEAQAIDRGSIGLCETIEDFVVMAEQHRDLLEQILVVIPVRPEGGMSLALSKMMAVWLTQGLAVHVLPDPMGGFIEMTRANIAYNFIEKHSEKYLMMIDSDIEPNPAAPLLLARHDADVVGSCAMTSSKTHGPQLCFSVRDTEGAHRFPTVGSGVNIPSSGLLEVGHVGTGCILIRRDVLAAFDYNVSQPCQSCGECNGDVPFYVRNEIRMLGASRGLLKRGEDIEFCRQVRDKGFKVHVDLECHVAHRKSWPLAWPANQVDGSLDYRSWVVPPVGMKFED